MSDPPQDPTDPRQPPLYCAAHTITGVLPGAPARHPFETRVDAIANAGFDGLSIHFRDHLRLVRNGADPGRMRDRVQAAGLCVPAVEFLGDWHGHPDLGSFDAALQTARQFGARWINVGVDVAGAAPPLTPLRDPFRAMCDRADAAGVGIALEVIAWGRVNTVDAALELISHTQGGAGMLLDVWHLAIAGAPSLEALADLDPSLVAGLQISDALPMQSHSCADLTAATLNRRFPGDGTMDVTGFLGALWPAALRTGVSVEVISRQAATMPADVCAQRAATSGRNALAAAGEIVARRGADGRRADRDRP